MDNETYREERKLLIDAEREASRSFDKTLITLSAGALVLSVTFVRDLKFVPDDNWKIYVAWFAFILSLLTIMISFLLSQSAMRRQREINDNLFEADGKEVNQQNWYRPCIIVLNWASLIFLIVGLLFFGLYAASNIFVKENI